MKLYVGNLPYHLREDDLRELFSPYGTTGTTTVVVDHQKDRSRGFGFIEFDDPAHGKAAIAAVNGTELAGRKLVVNEARPQPGGHSDRQGSRGGGYGGHRGGDRGGFNRPGGESGGGRPRY
ncbi:MAG: RNA recognition motif domain-containing protein [Acidobacteriota bacterium]